MRQIIASDAKKLEKIKNSFNEAIRSDDIIKLQQALAISVKTRDNSFSVENQLEMAKNPESPYDLFASDAFRLLGNTMRKACTIGAVRCLKYLLTIVPHEFRLHQRCLRAAVNAGNVDSVRALLNYTGKLNDELIIKHMSIVFMDEGYPDPIPQLAKKLVDEDNKK